jgi:hypothetical protein
MMQCSIGVALSFLQCQLIELIDESLLLISSGSFPVLGVDKRSISSQSGSFPMAK